MHAGLDGKVTPSVTPFLAAHANRFRLQIILYHPFCFFYVLNLFSFCWILYPRGRPNDLIDTLCNIFNSVFQYVSCFLLHFRIPDAAQLTWLAICAIFAWVFRLHFLFFVKFSHLRRRPNDLICNLCNICMYVSISFLVCCFFAAQMPPKWRDWQFV